MPKHVALERWMKQQRHPSQTKATSFGWVDWIVEKSIAELQELMARGERSAAELAAAYLDRISSVDPQLCSVVEVNPEALEIAAQLDQERANGHVRGPLHGVPLLLKENIDTDDAMQTTAGSLALAESSPEQDSTTAARLRHAGAVLLGKTAMSEWAYMRSRAGSSGWSHRGGQVRNPFVLDRSPGGSSSGSGTAASANLAAATIGTETHGSIMSPATLCGVVGIKPTVGLTSRAGVIPVSRSQDTVGPLARTVGDAAAVLGPLTGQDDRDPDTPMPYGGGHNDYTAFLDPLGIAGSRLGVARNFFGFSPSADAVVSHALEAMAAAGATLVEVESLGRPGPLARAEEEVMFYEFKADIALYLATRTPGSPRNLAELIQFNNDHANQEMAWFGQDLFELAEQKGPLTEPAYLEALATAQRLSRQEGLDRALQEHKLDALVGPTGGPASLIDLVTGEQFIGGCGAFPSPAGYPVITVPAGLAHGLPVGISFMGTAWSEPTLVKLASGYEALRGPRQLPQLIPSLRRLDSV